VRWWTRPVDPSRLILPGPFHGPQQWAARYYFYPWRVKREAKRSDLVHVLDHSYAHMIETAGRRPVVSRYMISCLSSCALADRRRGLARGCPQSILAASAQGAAASRRLHRRTEWLKQELATWLGNDKNISVVPFGVDRAFYGESTVARERGRREWRIPEDAFVVLHVGSTVDRKNVPLVIQTLVRLRQQTDAYLLQVGGRFTAEQEQLIDRLGCGVRCAVSPRPTRPRCGAPIARPTCCSSFFIRGLRLPRARGLCIRLARRDIWCGWSKGGGRGAAVVVEGRDPGDYVHALERLDDPEEREELVQKGWARARQFTWQKTAALTAEVYKPLF